MKDNKDFDNWYKTKITENDQDPPEGAWQNIADELDVNDVWNRISVKLDSPRGWSPSKAIYFAIPALLLLLSGGLYYSFNTTGDLAPAPTHIAMTEENSSSTRSTEPEVLDSAVDEVGENGKVGEVEEVGEVGEVVEKVGEVEKVEKVEKVGEVGKVGKVGEVGEVENVGEVEEVEEKVGEVVEVENAKEVGEVETVREVEKTEAVGIAKSEEFGGTEKIAQKLQHAGALNEIGEVRENATVDKAQEAGRGSEVVISLSANRAGIPAVIMPDSMLNIYPVTVTLHPDSLEWIAVADAPGKLMFERSVEFGITASVKNTWLLNRMTLMGLERHTLNTTVPDFGKDLGMVFTYNFSRAFSAQAEGMFISEAGQRYKEYRNGKYVDREADLRYYTLNVLLKYNRNKAVQALLLNGHSIVGGLYASRLNKATETINGEVSESNAYNDYNYGVILGYEYNRFVTSNLVVSSGLRINYGFPNIDERLFSKTFTGSFDLNVAVKYRFNR